MRKKIVFLIFLLISQMVFSQEKIRIGLIKGTSSLPFIFMMDDGSYEFVNFRKIEHLMEAMKAGTIVAANVSSVSASKIVKQTDNQICVAAVTSNTDYCVITRDGKLQSFSDLLGKKVHLIRNSLGDELFRLILEKNEIPVSSDEVGVEIVYDKDNSYIVKGLNSGEYEYAVLAEPYISAVLNNSKNVYKAIELQDEYNKIYGTGKKIPQTVLVVLSQFKDDYVSDYFRLSRDVQKSINSVKRQPVKAAHIIKDKNIGISPFYCTTVIKRMNLCFIETDMKPFSLSLINDNQ